MAGARTPIDEVDDEVIPASPGRRKRVMAVGCLVALVLLGALVWFAVTHTATTGDWGRFSW